MQTLQSEGSSDRAQVAGAVPSTTTGPGCSPAEAAGAASASRRERASTASPTPPCNGIVLPLQHTAPLTRFYLRTALFLQVAIPNIQFLSLYDLALLTRTQLFFFNFISSGCSGLAAAKPQIQCPRNRSHHSGESLPISPIPSTSQVGAFFFFFFTNYYFHSVLRLHVRAVFAHED